MFHRKGKLGVLAVIFATLALAGIGARAAARNHAPQEPTMTPAELVKAKIARALSAAPPDVAKDATVAEMNFLGKMTVLRPGTCLLYTSSALKRRE